MRVQFWFPAALAAFAFLSAPTVGAEELVPEIERDIAELEDLVSDSVEPPGVETALVFSNLGDSGRLVVCHARNAQGESVGAAAVAVPAKGVRHLIAADFSAGEPFAGQVTCKAKRPVVGSAFAVSGARLTDVPVNAKTKRKAVTLHFPIVATR